MNPIEVEAPDGSIVEFPAGTDQETIRRVMRENYGGPETEQQRFLPAAGRAARRGFVGVMDAVTGADSPIQAPEFQPATNRRARTLEDYQRATNISTGFTLTPDDQRRAEIIRSEYPEAEFTTDILLAEQRGIEWPENRTPRPMVRTGPDQEWTFINRPGFTVQDAQDIGADIAAFLPAGKFQAGGQTLIGRAGRGAVAGAATQAARDQASTAFGAEQGADLQRSVVTGGLQASSEPIVSLGGALFRRFGRNRGRQALTQADAARLNRNAANTPVEAPSGQPSTQGPYATGQSPEEVARRRLAGEFDMQLTQGQAARDPAQIRDELNMVRGGTSGREVLRPFMEGQVDAAISAGRSFATDAPGDLATVEGRNQAGARFRDTVREGADRLWQQVDDAYEVARGLDARFDPEGVNQLPGVVDGWLTSNSTRISRRNTPAAHEARQVIDELVAEVGEGGVTPVSLREIEGRRREILGLIDAAQTPADARAARQVREALDSWVDRAIDQALVIGDDGAIDALRNARGLRARYARTYSNGGASRRRSGSRRRDDGGDLIERIVEDELSGTQVMNLLFGRTELGNKRGTREALNRLITELGADSAEVGALREAYVARLLERMPNTSTTVQFSQRLARDWRDALSGTGSEITRELFTQEERSRMARFVRLLEEMAPPDGAGSSSGSAENMARILQREIGGLGRFLQLAGDVSLQFRTGFDPARSSARQMVAQPVAPTSGLLSNTARAASAGLGAETSGALDESTGRQDRRDN